MTDAKPNANPERDIHEFALNTNIRLSIRTGRATTPGHMWELASGTAAAWYAHRLLQRLAEVDPDGVQAFAELLVEEGEMPEVADNPVEVAQRMGFDAQAWIDAEDARRQTASTATAHSCDNCDGVDPTTCLTAPKES